MRHELKIEIRDNKYVDSLIISLVRQGYEVYLSEGSIYFWVCKEDLTELKD